MQFWSQRPPLLQPRPTAGSSSSSSSSMELWGTYLVLCLLSLLTQVTAESPTPKVKKAANVKKGKEGLGPLSISQGAGHLLLRSPQAPSGPNPGHLVESLPAPHNSRGPGEFSSRGGCQNCKDHRLSESERTLQIIKTDIHPFPPPRSVFRAWQSGDARLSSENTSGLCFVISEPQVSQL